MGDADFPGARMAGSLFYALDSPRLGTAVIINNLDSEQEPTRRDVARMAEVLKDIGFTVEIHRDLTSRGMNGLKREMTRSARHRDASCFLLLVISHGTADNFLQDREGTKTWNLESLVTEICDMESLVGKPKLFFIEACRGREHNIGSSAGPGLAAKSSLAAPQTQGITLPSKQDVFVGFATVPGFVSFTSSTGSPYLQALAGTLAARHATTDLADMHLLVKRRLAGLHLGREGARQGAEERSSLLGKLLFSRHSGVRQGSIVEAGLPAVKGGPAGPGPARTKREAGEDHIISQGGADPLPRASLFSFPYSSPLPATFTTPSLALRPLPEVSRQTAVHVIEILSSDVEAGLNQLLVRVVQVYGGSGKVGVRRRRRWGAAEEGAIKKYSFKYLGPERAALLLERALLSVRELQGRAAAWKFTQRLEVGSGGGEPAALCIH
jgi:hypothetical protein